jgi:hydroxymethylglutaryl-CoA reductase (NADPH)
VDIFQILALSSLVASLVYLFSVAFVKLIVSSTDENKDFLVGSSAVPPAPVPRGYRYCV